MAYSAEISRSNPTCFVFIIDQSGSMADSFGGEGVGRKADFVADVVNRTLHDLVIRATRTEEIRNYYYISMIARYGGAVQPSLSGALAGREMVPGVLVGLAGQSRPHRESHEENPAMGLRAGRSASQVSNLG